MTAAIRIESVGKRFAHRDVARPRTVRQFVEGGWRHLGGRYTWALRNVDFAVEEGEVFGVIGRNGAGKSTLLRLLGGVMRPDEGRIVASDRVSGLLDLNAGMHPDLTGRENAIATGIIAGLRKRDIIARMDDVIAFSELEGFIDEPVRTYSAGMRLRLGFAVAMQTKPRILLIDEVLAVGDIAFQRKCLERIEEFRVAGCAIILISHDLAQVEAMCDRVLWLKDGVSQGIGPASDMVHRYEAEILQEQLALSAAKIAPVDDGQPHLTFDQNRFGTLENRITRVRILNSRGTETNHIKYGQGMTLQMWVESAVPLSELHLSFCLFNDKDAHLVDFGTDDADVVLPDTIGTTMVQIDIDRLELGGGTYPITLGVYDRTWETVFDSHEKAYEIEISGEPSTRTYSPSRRWTIAVPQQAGE
ncbi:MAG: ABC transporter ATP-binding protein [Sphingobium sp.]